MFRYGNHSFVIATNEDLLKKIHRLRYDLYVRECGGVALGTKGTQQDPYDRSAIHLAAVNSGGEVLGTARLILNAAEGLPIFQTLAAVSAADRGDTGLAEVSRLRIDAGDVFKSAAVRPPSDGLRLATAEQPVSHAKRLHSVLSAGLVALLLQVSLRLGLERWVMASEKRSCLDLRRLGVDFRPMKGVSALPDGRCAYEADLRTVDRSLLTFHDSSGARLRPLVDVDREDEMLSPGRRVLTGS